MFDKIVTQLNALNATAMRLGDLHDAVAGVKRVRSALDALEARLLTAAADRTFDPAAGLEMMRSAGGCSQREARRRLRRAETLDQMPEVAGALASGDITAEHADALAQAARTTSAEAVNDDAALLEKTKALPADLAAREVADWTHRRQTEEAREAKLRRQRQMRSHRTWSDAEGMVNFRTRLDPVTGAQARAVIDDIANRLYQADGGRDAKGDQIRTWEQRNADAFAAALGVIPNPDTSTGIGSIGNTGTLGTDPAGQDDPQQPVTGPAGRSKPTLSLRNQILVVTHTDAITGADPDARCEIPGTGPIPRSELERLACQAELFGILFDGNGLPLWHGRRTRTVSPQQWRTLVARDRGCVLCGTSPSHCHAHHIIPWSPPAAGPTDIDNLALVCNRHHHHIHQHNLTLARGPDGCWTAAAQTAARSTRAPATRAPASRSGSSNRKRTVIRTSANRPPPRIRAGP